jgi:hypothetical protein
VIENAILLCAQCHNDYGNNPLKRKQLKQARDDWHDIVAHRYSKKEIDRIEQLATKQDIDQIAAELRRLTGIIEAIVRAQRYSSALSQPVSRLTEKILAPS